MRLKKSMWDGLAGAVVVAMLLGMLFGAVLTAEPNEPVPPPYVEHR